ncbi:hypothetical protein Droror1_Dr00027873 [Drosera rotundifolia]
MLKTKSTHDFIDPDLVFLKPQPRSPSVSSSLVSRAWIPISRSLVMKPKVLDLGALGLMDFFRSKPDLVGARLRVPSKPPERPIKPRTHQITPQDSSTISGLDEVSVLTNGSCSQVLSILLREFGSPTLLGFEVGF